MNTIIESKPLNEALKLCARICNRNASLPILAQALIEVRGDKTEITVTDLDQTLIVTIPSGQGGVPGKCCVPLHRLQKAVASSKKDVRLEYNEKTGLKVINGATFTIATMPADDFPPTPKLKTQDFAITAGNLKLLLKSVGYCQSTDQARYVLNGVCFEPHKGMLRAIATDGRRLSMMETPCSWKEEHADPLRLLIPSPAVDFLNAALSNGKEGVIADSPVLFGFTEGAGGYADFGFKRGELNVQLITKRIEGTYPNYHQVIPESANHRCWFQREELLNVMAIMEDNTTEKHEAVRMVLEKNSATFTAGPPDCRCSMNVTVNFKEAATITFRPSYLLDTLKGLYADEIAIELTDHLSPLVVTMHTPDQFKAVIMPMRMS